MAIFRIDDTIVNTANAQNIWKEDTEWNGHNHISKATGDQWLHQTLYKSSKGRYYLVCSSQWQGSTNAAEWIEPIDAARWLLTNNHELPADLSKYLEKVCE